MRNKDHTERVRLKKIEDMMIKIAHLTGQHYKDKFWLNIVKGSALDMHLFIDKILKDQREEILKSIPKKRVGKASNDLYAAQDDGFNQAIDEFTTKIKKI